MDETEFRRLGPDDADLVVAAGDTLFDDPPRADWTAAALADPATYIVGAVRGGALVAFAAGAILRQPDKPPAFYVNELGVIDALHRRGIGTDLLRATMRVARKAGCATMLVTAEEDDPRARAFYGAARGREDAVGVVYIWPL